MPPHCTAKHILSTPLSNATFLDRCTAPRLHIPHSFMLSVCSRCGRSHASSPGAGRLRATQRRNTAPASCCFTFWASGLSLALSTMVCAAPVHLWLCLCFALSDACSTCSMAGTEWPGTFAAAVAHLYTVLGPSCGSSCAPPQTASTAVHSCTLNRRRSSGARATATVPAPVPRTAHGLTDSTWGLIPLLEAHRHPPSPALSGRRPWPAPQLQQQLLQSLQGAP